MDTYRMAPPAVVQPEARGTRRPSAPYVLFAWAVQLIALVGLLLGLFVIDLKLDGQLPIVPEAALCMIMVAYGRHRLRDRRTHLYPSPWFFW